MTHSVAKKHSHPFNDGVTGRTFAVKPFIIVRSPLMPVDILFMVSLWRIAAFEHTLPRELESNMIEPDTLYYVCANGNTFLLVFQWYVPNALFSFLIQYYVWDVCSKKKKKKKKEDVWVAAFFSQTGSTWYLLINQHEVDWYQCPGTLTSSCCSFILIRSMMPTFAGSGLVIVMTRACLLNVLPL